MSLMQERPVDEQVNALPADAAGSTPDPTRQLHVAGPPVPDRPATEELGTGRRHGDWRPGLWGFIRDIVDRGDRDRILGLAAETAFFAILGLFPALLMFAGVLGQLDAFIGEDVALSVEAQTVTALQRVLTDRADGAIATVEELFRARTDLLTVATALALVSVSTAFATVVNALNRAYDVPETRSWFRRRLLGLSMGLGTVVVGAMVLIVIVVGPLLLTARVSAVIGIAPDDELFSVVRPLLAFSAMVLWATLLCHLSPARRTPMRLDLLGALLTASLWLAASAGFNIYLRVVSGSNPLLGALGGGLIVMSWFYLLTLSLLIGAEVNAELQRRWGVEPVLPRRHRGRRARRRVLALLPRA